MMILRLGHDHVVQHLFQLIIINYLTFLLCSLDTGSNVDEARQSQMTTCLLNPGHADRMQEYMISKGLKLPQLTSGGKIIYKDLEINRKSYFHF
jgi:hypothetical protein